MKLAIYAIYTRYTSHTISISISGADADADIQPTDAYTGHPAGGSLYLRFEPVD